MGLHSGQMIYSLSCIPSTVGLFYSEASVLILHTWPCAFHRQTLLFSASFSSPRGLWWFCVVTLGSPPILPFLLLLLCSAGREPCSLVSPLISCFFFSWLPASWHAQRRVMELFLYTGWEWKRQRNPGTIKDRKVEPTPISTGKQKFRKIGDPVLRQRCRNPCPLLSMALILVRLPYLPFSWKTGSTPGLPSEPPQPQFQEWWQQRFQLRGKNILVLDRLSGKENRSRNESQSVLQRGCPGDRFSAHAVSVCSLRECISACVTEK